jgi:hypothetical protein
MSERIGMEPARSRHDRVTEWMAANGVDALVAARADLVAWLAGYSRYYGGLSAVVVVGPDGELGPGSRPARRGAVAERCRTPTG